MCLSAALLAVLLDCFPQCSEANIVRQHLRQGCTAQQWQGEVAKQTQTELHFLCPAKDTKPTAGSEVSVTPAMQTSPF